MRTTALGQRPVSPRTHQQQQSRLWSMVVLLLILGPLTVLSGTLLCALARAVKKPRAFAWLALAGLVGLALLVWQWRALAAEVLMLGDAARPLGGILRPKPNQPVTLHQISQAGAQVWPILWLLWRQAILLAPMVASYIHTSKVKTAEELEQERALGQERATHAAIQNAAARSAKAPAAAGGQLVLGVPIGGDLTWEQSGWFTYPAAILGRHLVLVGSSGSGKTETCKRLAYGAAQVYCWRVFYLDCKGDDKTADQFLGAMRAAGLSALARFPNDAYDGWRGDASAILNRLMMILDFTEPYYRDLTRMLLSLAVDAPPGPPRSSAELLVRLSLDELSRRYAGMPESRELTGIRSTDAQAVYNRYRAFFKALRGGLDGAWAFEDMQAGYIQLRGLDLKDQTASLGRYILEDFAHYVATRKAADDQVLLIVDEFPAIAFGGASAAGLFEMVRFHGAGIVVTAQSYAGLGADAERILGAAAGLILHQCADPERLLIRSGENLAFQRRVSFTNAVKQLGQGECVVIAGGRAQHIAVSQVRLPAPKQSATLRPDAYTTSLEIAEIDRVARRERYLRTPSMVTSAHENAARKASDTAAITHTAESTAGEPIREY